MVRLPSRAKTWPFATPSLVLNPEVKQTHHGHAMQTESLQMTHFERGWVKDSVCQLFLQTLNAFSGYEIRMRCMSLLISVAMLDVTQLHWVCKLSVIETYIIFCRVNNYWRPTVTWQETLSIPVSKVSQSVIWLFRTTPKLGLSTLDHNHSANSCFAVLITLLCGLQIGILWLLPSNPKFSGPW